MSIDPQPTSPPTRSEKNLTPRDKPRRRVLAAEDDGPTALLLARLLEQLGYQVDVAHDGDSAWEMYAQHPYQIVISDWMMPGLEGTELIRRVRSDAERPYTYIMLLTSRATREDRLIGLQSGADDIMGKPPDRHELDAKLAVAERILCAEDRARRAADDLKLSAGKLRSLNEMLDHASQRFQELFDGLPIACFTCDAHGAIFEWNRACEALYKFDGTVVMQQTIWDTVCRPEDELWFREHLQRVFEGETLGAIERLDRCGDGSNRLVLSTVLPLRSKGGGVVGAICANVDITERKADEERLSLLSLVAQKSTNGICIAGPDNRLLFANQAMQDQTGYTMEELLGQDLYRLIFGPNTGQYAFIEMERAVQTLKPVSVEAITYHKSGTTFWAEMHITPISNAEGQLTHVVIVQNDISGRKQMQHLLEQEILRSSEYSMQLELRRQELEEANARLEALAVTDGLTGLLNHRAFQERLAREFELSAEHHTPLSLILLDVDHFKQYNDAFGHPAGDEVLKSVSRILRDTAPADSLVARYGGEEFVAVLPGATAATALSVANELRRAIEAGSWTLRAITVSLGVATLSTRIADRVSLVAAADEALYSSKRAGRNRATHADALEQEAA